MDTDGAMKKFDEYIDLWVKLKPTVADKVLFCIHRGQKTPRELIARLEIAKGNLANCCKCLIHDGQIVQHTNGRAVEYEPTAAGREHIESFFSRTNSPLR